MDMEVVRSSVAAALLLLTLVVLAAASASGVASAGDDAAAAWEDEKRRHPRAGEPYMLVAFHNKDNGEEVRLLTDQRSWSEKQISGVSAFANRSGNWFYTGLIRNRKEGNGKRRGVLPLPQPNDDRTAEGRLWDTLGVLVNSSTATASDDPAEDDDDDEGYYYMFVGLQTSGGDKIRLLLVVTDHERYFFVAGFARGFFRQPHWSFRDGERHRFLLPTTLGGNGSSHSHGGGSSSSSRHAEAVASNVLAALMEDAKACCG